MGLAFGNNLDFPDNIGLGVSPQVWLFSDFDSYNQLRSGGYAPYLTFAQQARLERLRQARLLHDGKHWRMFIFEGRSQFNFPEVEAVGGVKRPLFVPYNLLQLIARKSADLLFGDEPAIRVTEELQAKAIADLVERNNFHQLLGDQAIECAGDGECYFQGVIQNGQVYLKRIDAADIFPVGKIQPNGQYQSYIQYNAKNVGTKDKPDWMLLTTTYEPGFIRRKLQKLNQEGFIMPRELTLHEWPQEDPQEEPIEPEVATGLDYPNIVFVPNRLVREFVMSDFDGLIELQDALNAKHTQVARALAQHSDPKLAVPRYAFDQNGAVHISQGAFAFDNPDQIPKYITWNAELESAIRDRQEVRDALLTKAEIAPILLGIKTGATGSSHSAFKSVRLEAVNTIAMIKRKAIIWKAAIRSLITLAQDLEQRIPGVRYNRVEPGIDTRDGIPIDSDAQANEISTLRGAGVMSVERAVELLLPDPTSAAKELAALEREEAAKVPTTLMQEPGETGDAPPASEAGLEGDEEDATQDQVEVAA